MQEIVGNILAVTADAIVIPTNTTFKLRGKKPVAIMGAGLAYQAAKRWPELPGLLGNALQILPQPSIHGFYPDEKDAHPVVLAFPTKKHYRDDSSLEVIEGLLQQLVALTTGMQWKTVAVPRLGCGLGNRDWEKEVKPLMAKYLDDRFLVVYPHDTRYPRKKSGD